jgi:hypothetical protein
MANLVVAIVDLICEYMRELHRHYFDYRILRWNMAEDPSRVFNAVIIINPPNNPN